MYDVVVVVAICCSPLIILVALFVNCRIVDCKDDDDDAAGVYDIPPSLSRIDMTFSPSFVVVVSRVAISLGNNETPAATMNATHAVLKMSDTSTDMKDDIHQAAAVRPVDGLR